jgi:hypothetical protein
MRILCPRFPTDAGMKLTREPRAFNLHSSRHIMRLISYPVNDRV